ncbi:MAG: ComEC/Rec2 family competence protein [Clostridia bacterium]|nr:ComEC/Rec2 family competence protein [Clostridia bacterium]
MTRILNITILSVFLLAALIQTAQSEAPAFEIHFIDVGHGDAAVVVCEGEYMLIDGGDENCGKTVCDYLNKMNISRLDYLVYTHPHKDNVGGLTEVVERFPIGDVFGSVTAYDTIIFSSFMRALSQSGEEIIIPEAGYEFDIGSARATVLGPVKQSSDMNNMSLVMRVVYDETSFLLCADAMSGEENDILQTAGELSSDVIKISCQGSDEATSELFLAQVMPRYAVISTATRGDNVYGHPNDAMLTRLNQAGIEVYRTDLNGTVICSSDGKEITITAQKDEIQAHNGADTEEMYIINTNSDKFHRPDCRNVASIAEENRLEITASPRELIREGYSPCGNCAM